MSDMAQIVKACSKCGLPREIRRYCKPCKQKNDKARNSAAYSADPNKFVALAAKWRDSNPEQYRANQAEWRRKNVLKMRAYRAKWREKNQEVARSLTAAWRDANPEKGRVQKAAFYKAHPERRVQFEIVRRARKRSAAGYHSESEWIELKEKHDFRCIDCGRREGDKMTNGKPMKLTRGHAVPLSKRGANSIDNIIPQCSRCNGKQGTKIHPSVKVQGVAA